MRKNSMIIALVAGGIALATTNLKAQGADEMLPPVGRAQTNQPDQNSKGFEPAHNSAGASNLKAKSIIGLAVRNDSGERLGAVQDLIVNLDTHSTPFAIVEYGGTLGIGETRVAVPLTDLKWSSEPRQLILTTTKEQFQAASPAPTGGWMAVADEDWAKNVDRFYGQPSATSSSRFERQEMPGMSEGREPVRNPSEQKGASELEGQLPGTNLGATNMVSKPIDEALTEKVNRLIRQAVGDQAGQIQATIANGVVTLSGSVPSETQRKALAHQIMELPGVAQVKDDLTVRSD
jgi:sporulation protein YlmC with PRC-barrel domain